MKSRSLLRLVISVVASIFACMLAPHLLGAPYVQQNLVSGDNFVSALVMDPNLINPWGIVTSATSPFWVSDQGTGLSTIYTVNSGGVTVGSLVVTIPTSPSTGGSDPQGPTGIVFNGGSGFVVNGSPARFIFANLDGTISAWNSGSSAVLEVDNHDAGASYQGLAIFTDTPALYAANFSAGGGIDVFDTNFAPLTLGGSCVDPNLPAGYAPFNIQNIAGQLYVAYALVDGGVLPVFGPGNGLVDVFDTDCNLVTQLIPNGGQLNAPWGMAIATANFGAFSNDLLVGNFGDGTINAFDPNTGDFLGALSDVDGNPITNVFLWGLTFGNGGSGGLPDTLYITAGLNGQQHGVLAAINAMN